MKIATFWAQNWSDKENSIFPIFPSKIVTVFLLTSKLVYNIFTIYLFYRKYNWFYRKFYQLFNCFTIFFQLNQILSKMNSSWFIFNHLDASYFYPFVFLLETKLFYTIICPRKNEIFYLFTLFFEQFSDMHP